MSCSLFIFFIFEVAFEVLNSKLIRNVAIQNYINLLLYEEII